MEKKAKPIKSLNSIFKKNKFEKENRKIFSFLRLNRSFEKEVKRTELLSALKILERNHTALQDASKDEEAEFVPEEVQEIAFAVIDKIIGENSYSEIKVTMWTTAIIERVLTELAKLKRPFKYIINCSLQQKTGAGLHLASACYWDPAVDGACTVKWSNDYIHCCLHVFGLQI